MVPPHASAASAAAAVADRSSYWNDDFRPLQDAGRAVLAKLRDDEQQGDLYRRIMAKTPAALVSNSAAPGGRGNGTSNVGGGIRSGTDGSGPAGFASDAAAAAAGEEPANDPAHHYFPNGPVQHAKSIPLPPYLQGLLTTKLKISTTMGLLPQAEMAWMTIDDTVYLWTYHHSFVSGTGGVGGASSSSSSTAAGGGDPSHQFLEFQVPSRQPIISVGLAPPKPGK
jgi:hypothetical protein